MEIITAKNYDEIRNKIYPNISTGIEKIDKAKGFTMVDFMVLAGGSGSGKSTLALFMACFMAKAGQKIVYFNCEISSTLLLQKIAQLGFNFNSDFGKTNSDGHHRLHIINVSTLRFEQVKQYVKIHTPQVVFIDLFSSLLSGLDMQTTLMKTEQYATEFSYFGEKYGCAVITTAQLVKDNKRVTRPTLDDIRGGATLVHKATQVINIYRYTSQQMDNIEANQQSISLLVERTTELIVRKDRAGKIKLGFDYIYLTDNRGFEALSYSEINEYTSKAFKKKSYA